MRTKIDLPPLPEPFHGFYAAPMYSADQMRAYAQAALDALADEAEASIKAMIEEGLGQVQPVAWQAVGGSIWGHKTSEDDRPLYTEGSWNKGYKHGQWQAKHCAALAQPVPATPADMAIYQAIADNYTHPQPVPLTDSEIDAITRELFGQQIGAMMVVHRLHARAVLFAAGIVPAPTTGEGRATRALVTNRAAAADLLREAAALLNNIADEVLS